MKKIKILPFLFIASLPSFALETDNYYVWPEELKDANAPINEYINGKIQNVVESVNAKYKTISCQKLAFKVGKKFRTFPPFLHPLEDWIQENLNDDYIFPIHGKYRSDSIYKNRYRFYLKYMKLAPNVQINGVHLGTDKLSHFLSTGRRYYKHYLKKKKRGYDEENAVKSAIRFGLKNEASILGTLTSGVFSYGDMEANYQGLKFYKNICENEDSYLKKDSHGKWSQIKDFDIQDYVNPYWDESFNISYRVPRNWNKVSLVIKDEYCSIYQSDIVQRRFDYYRSFEIDRYSLDYIIELQESYSRLAPDPAKYQSVDELCATE